MRRWATLALMLLMTAGCTQYEGVPVEAYEQSSDRLAILSGLAGLGVVWPCTRRERGIRDVAAYGSIPHDQCYVMEPRRRWTGIFRASMRAGFCPGVAAPIARRCGNWLEFTGAQVDRLGGNASEREGPGLYFVEFDGRRTKFKGRYRVGGMAPVQQIYVVDRLIRMQRVGDVPQSEVAQPNEPLG